MIELEIVSSEPEVELEVQEVMKGQGSGTDDYEELKNRPSINDVVLSGDKTFIDLGLSPLSNMEIMGIINKASNEGGMDNGDI